MTINSYKCFVWVPEIFPRNRANKNKIPEAPNHPESLDHFRDSMSIEAHGYIGCPILRALHLHGPCWDGFLQYFGVNSSLWMLNRWIPYGYQNHCVPLNLLNLPWNWPRMTTKTRLSGPSHSQTEPAMASTGFGLTPSRYQWKEEVRIDAVLEAQHIERSAAQKAWDEKMRLGPRKALDGVKFRPGRNIQPAIT